MPSERAPSMAGRALLAAVLLVGFYVLGLVVAGLLFVTPFLVGKYTDRSPGLVIWFCLAGGVTILWSLIPRRDRFEPPGPLIDREAEPALIALVEEVARKTGQEPPSEVYLILDVNAWVGERGGLLGFGTRRVMGLGLPLLQALSIAQMRAVLAHEFGHFDGGDTKVGAWLYRTRAGIIRTVERLGDHIAQYPFLLYMRLFLRATSGVSRMQELAADRLAASVIGAQPLVEGLERIHIGAMAFPAYWMQEVVPVLESGSRPPVLEGFDRFLSAPLIAEQAREAMDAELVHGTTDPYDTHPPYRERVAAVKGMSAHVEPPDERPTLELICDLPALELRSLETMAGPQAARSLEPIAWDDVAQRIWPARWKEMLGTLSASLRSRTLADIPQLAKLGIHQLGPVVGPDAGSLHPEDVRSIQRNVFGAAFALALCARGFRVDSGPGEDIVLRRDDTEILPFTVVGEVIAHERSVTSFLQVLEETGCRDALISPPADG